MRKSKSVHFFATRRDLEAILAAVEAERRLKYTQVGMFDSPETTTFTSALQIPNLGFAPSGEHTHEPFWLITDAVQRWRSRSSRSGAVARDTASTQD